MRVRGDSGKSYSVEDRGGWWTCTCMDYRMRQSRKPRKHRACKHIRRLQGGAWDEPLAVFRNSAGPELATHGCARLTLDEPAVVLELEKDRWGVAGVYRISLARPVGVTLRGPGGARMQVVASTFAGEDRFAGALANVFDARGRLALQAQVPWGAMREHPSGVPMLPSLACNLPYIVALIGAEGLWVAGDEPLARGVVRLRGYAAPA